MEEQTVSKHKTGDKFVIEIEAERLGDPILYRIKGFNTLVFDDNGLDRLEQVNGGPTLRDAYDEGYKKGLRDAWECARKATLYDVNIYEVFGITILKHLYDMNPSEAVAKLKEHEAKQAEIKVGDEIISDGGKGVVTCVNSNTCDVIWFDGSVSEDFEEEFFRKTGRHYDIKSILEQLKGADNEV